MADTLETLEIEVKHNSSGASKEIGKVTSAIVAMSKALSVAIPQLKDYAETLSKVGSSVRGSISGKKSGKGSLSDDLREKIRDADRYEIALHKIADAQAQMSRAALHGDENAAWRARERELNARDQAQKHDTTSPLPIKAQEVIETASAVDVLKAKLIRLEDALQEAFAHGDRDKAFNIRGQILQTESALARANRAAAKASDSMKKAAQSTKELSDSAKKSKTPLENFISSLKRIAFYRIIRSIIKSITQAFQEGLQNAYAFSQGIEGDGHRFAAAMDSMKTAGTTMKNQLGSAFIGLLTAIAPAVNAIISLVTKLANALSQLFAVFTGGTYLKAAEVPQQYAEAAGGAAKKTKEWRNQLLGFDEINRLDEPNDPSGGGGGGAADIMSAFEDTPIDGIFKKIRDKLIELKDSLDFEPLKKSWEHLKESLQRLADVIMGALAWAWENILVPLAHWTIEKLAPQLVELLANAFNLLCAILERLAPVFDWLWQHIMKPLFEFIGSVVITVLDNLNRLLKDLADLIDGKITFKEFIKGASDMELVIGVLCAALGVGGLIGLLNTLKDVVLVGVFLAVGKVSTALSFLAANPIVLVIAGVVALVTAIVLLIKHWDEVSEAVQRFQQKLSDALHDGELSWMDFAAVAVQTIMAPIDAIITLIGWIQSLVSWIQTALEGFGILSAANANAAAIQANGSIYLQGFASGGHPDDGQLFIARENGAEMVGSMGGRTTVATNDDIVEGIRQGVFEAVMAANNNGNNNVDVRVYLDSREIKAGQNRLNRAMGVG